MSNVVSVKRCGNYAVVVVPDESPENPREWSNIGKICFSKRGEEECSEKDLEKAAVVLAVWMYKHSAVAMKATEISREKPFGDNPFKGWLYWDWDSGAIGWVAAFADDIHKEYNKKRISPKLRVQVIERMKSEIETYGKYCNGEVYGYELYKVDGDVPDNKVRDEGDLIDSCYGYYSVDDAIEDGKAAIPDEVKEAAD